MATLESARIRLRTLDERDAAFIMSLENDEEIWASGDTRAPYPESLIRDYLLTYDPDPLRAGQLRLVVEEKESMKPVGTIDLTEVDPRAMTCRIGIAIAGLWRRRGLAAEALEAAERYCSIWLGIRNIRADVASGNTPAIALFHRAGYSLTGLLRQWHRIGPRIADIVIFQKLF